jgi:hypothetical protein
MFDQKDCKGNKYDSGGPINGCRNLKTGPGMAPIYSFWCSGCKMILAGLAVCYTNNSTRRDRTHSDQSCELQMEQESGTNSETLSVDGIE